MTMQMHSDVSVPPAVRESAEDLWERTYPGRGKAILDVLGPCYASSVFIGPSISGPSVMGEGIMDTAKAVYHWLVRNNGFTCVIEQRYASRFPAEYLGQFEWLDDLLKRRYPLRLQAIPSACFERMAPGNADGFEHLEDALPAAFRLRLWESYMSTVRMAAAYALQPGFPDEAAYFKRVIALWHVGCLPVGIGRTSRGVPAVVFIASGL
jgi:hypothetical protein